MLATSSLAQGNWSMAFNHIDGYTLPPTTPPNATNPYAPFLSPPFTGITTPVGFPGFPVNSFNAVHMSLIPKGPHRGKVLVWDVTPVVATPQPANVQWSFQSYAIVDPAPVPAGPRFRNFLLPIQPIQTGPNGPFAGDLFCSGHAWSPYGDLVVAGGTAWNLAVQQYADNMTWVFDPNQPVAPFQGSASLYPNDVGFWVQGPTLTDSRYYPTVTLTHRLQRLQPQRETMLVLGGSAWVNGTSSDNPTWNSFEALRIAGQPAYNPSPALLVSGLTTDTFNGNTHWAGPSIVAPGVDDLFEYPRAHLLTTGQVFLSGYPQLSAKEDHETTLWDYSSGRTLPTGGWNTIRHYGASIRFPNIGGLNDLIVRIGGCTESPFSTNPGSSTNTVEFCLAATPQSGWVQTYQLNQSRYLLNAVLLPDASILVVGGVNRVPGGSTYLYTPELFQGTGWTAMANAQSPRDYHSTAILLPDGRVIVAGGNNHTIDYEVFEPPYLAPGVVRPANVVLSNTTYNSPLDARNLNYATTGVNAECDALPLGVALQKVVLMAPGSTTHHSDMSQRYHEMVFTSIQPNKITFTTPGNDKIVPRGLYMLFLVTNLGIPSNAVWVYLS